MSTNQDALVKNHLIVETKIKIVIDDCKQIVNRSAHLKSFDRSKSPINSNEDNFTFETDTISESRLITATNVKKVIDGCKQIGNQSNEALKPISSNSRSYVKDDNLTLEKIVRDMTCVLHDLKNGIKLVKSSSKIASFHNVENELEAQYNKKQEETKKRKEAEEQKKKEAANQQKNKKSDSIKQVQKNRSNQGNQNKQNVTQKRASSAGKALRGSNESTLNKQNSLQKRASSADKAVAKRGSNQNTSSRPNSSQKRARSADKTLVKRTSNQNEQTVTESKKRTSSIEMPIPPRRVTPRPNSSTNNNNQTKPIITTVKFPTENTNVTANVGPARQDNNRARNISTEQTLRKPSANPNGRRVVSIPTPREVYNPLGILKDEVERAIIDNKTFTIKGRFAAVRKALLKRGWIEKYHTNYRERINDEIRRYVQMSLSELVDLLRHKELAPTIKNLIKSKLLKDHQLTMINRFRRESFSYTSKQGLCQAAREHYWLQIPGVARINHPRCYVLAKGGDTKSFLRDFGLTAATCLLKWVVRNNITGESKIISSSGKIPIKTFDFAITECYKFFKRQKHQDIDEEIVDSMENEWNDFLEQFYKTVHIGNHFKLNDKNIHPSQASKEMVRKANYLLNEIREYMPCLDMDGIMNIWILKPTNSSRGEGIHICRTLQFILEIVRKNPNRRYIIQKYIERPLLIHDTKFDIRQWFLVSSSYPLTIWMYKLCYLRFSCQTYNLRKLHESIHLTNNSIQAKYLRNVANRDPLLPSYGMWNSKNFKDYLSDIGYPSIFDDTIYPGMKQCITGAMIAHRDKMDKRKNCFEMYGADFMLSEKFEPWLLEINSNPALHGSTPVTTKMCPEVLEDVIKVDYTRNKAASTGNFELIYQETVENYIPSKKANFHITGTPIPDDYFCDIPEEKEPKNGVTVSLRFKTPDPGQFLLQTGETMKESLKKLLEIVKKEKMKRRSRREKGIETEVIATVSATQTTRELISIYENSMSRKSSCSVKQANSNSSQEQLSESESKRITEALGEIESLQNKKQLLSDLVEVVDTLEHTSHDMLKNEKLWKTMLYH